jgi:serine/threonine protein kinase
MRAAIVHHNIIPEAIVFPKLARRFPVCLVDWSSARTLDSSSPIPLIAGERMEPYAAPERARGAIDIRSDIYSLGVIARDLIRRAPSDAHPPIFTALVHRMISSDPEQRPTAKSVRDHAAYLATQIPHEEVVYVADEDTEQMPLVVTPSVPGAITSELAPEVSGEID